MKNLCAGIFGILMTFFSFVSANEAQPSFTLQTLSGGQQVCTKDGQPIDCSVMFGKQGLNADMKEVSDYSARSIEPSKCVVNGEEVPCTEAMKVAKNFLNATMLIFGILALIGTVFWIWMLVDTIRFHEKNIRLWIILQIILGFIGSIIYFFAARRPRKTNKS